MNIQDAIKQAGEGGKIKRACWGGNDVAAVVPQKDSGAFSVEQVLADDWEVVTPDIEVGDVVHTRTSEKTCHNCEVLSIEDDKHAALHRLAKGGCACVEPIRDLTLIRKGAKKFVYKNISWGSETMEELLDKDIGLLMNNGKKYTMTLEESQ